MFDMLHISQVDAITFSNGLSYYYYYYKLQFPHNLAKIKRKIYYLLSIIKSIISYPNISRRTNLIY